MSQATEEAAGEGMEATGQQKRFRSSSGDYRNFGTYQKEIVESYDIKLAREGSAVTGLDQSRTSSVEVNEAYFFPVVEEPERRFEMKHQIETVTEQSKLRLVEGVLSEANSLRKDKEESNATWYRDGRVKASGNRQSWQQQQLKLVGDLQALAQDKALAERYVDGLQAVNRLMAKV